MKTFFTFLLFTLSSCLSAYSKPVLHYNPLTGPAAEEMIRSNLSILGTDGTPTLVDGDLTQYDESYSNAVDGMDARKLSNFSENIGMLRGTTVLVIERRHTIETTDSIFYKIWNLRQTTYQLQFIMSNLNQTGLSGYLEDDYLHQNTPLDLNGTNNINFTITTDPASANIYRFKIIFSTDAARLLPLTFTSVKAVQQNNSVMIDWKTANETELQQYNLERSADGSHFTTLDVVSAYNLSANTYSWNDKTPLPGTNYYRVQGKDVNGKTSNSDVIKVYAGNISHGYAVFPNPVTNGQIHLQLFNQPQGDYTIRLLNGFGQTALTQVIHYGGGNSNVTMGILPRLAKGIYQLEITQPDGVKNNIKIVFEIGK